MRHPESELIALEEQSLRRQLREISSPQGSTIILNGKECVNFASNDYLGLSIHPKIKQAFIEGVQQWGAGSGASRLISGTLSPHSKLETFIAQIKNKPAARVFANGYTTSVGVLSGLLQKGDTIILDKLSHASLIDGAKLSGATIRVFPHNKLEKLEALLSKCNPTKDSRVIVVTESIFSMDGDIAPLEAIIQLKQKYGALLLVDEAHALGVRGTYGLGHEMDLLDGIDLHMGTLGKSAGVAGGYIATSSTFAELITNRSRSFIYSTAAPPAQSHAALVALKLIGSYEGEALIAKLWRNIHFFAECMQLQQLPESAIIPWHIGESREALEISQKLLSHGIFAPAVRFPTVPKNTARLRITLSALHTEEQIEALCERLKA